ncbi:MAG: methyltransferase domain-containing protein [Actinomycetota bacterium]
MPSWDSARYLQFEEHRTRPARDLLARVPHQDPATVIDVGCGPGNSTSLLLHRWPRSTITAIDSSPEMLAQAGRSVPGVTFVESDLRAWRPPRPADVVFSNATLQWLGDHPAVLDHLLSWLAPGGALAVQMPRNYAHPSHLRMRELAGARGEVLRGVLRVDPVATPIEYYRMLAGAGRHVDVWETEYLHVLEGDDPVVEWLRGSGLRPVLDRLGPEEGEGFVAEFAAAMRDAYPPEPDGTTLFPFLRLFFVVTG